MAQVVIVAPQPPPLNNDQYFRRFMVGPTTPQPVPWENAIINPSLRPAAPATPMPIGRGAPGVVPPTSYHPLYGIFGSNASNLGLVMAVLGTLCRAMNYPLGGDNWFPKVAASVNGGIAVAVNTTGPVLKNQVKYCTQPAAGPQIGIFRPDAGGTILAVRSITPSQSWKGQLPSTNLTDTDVFKTASDASPPNHNTMVGNQWLVYAQECYGIIKTEFGGLGGDKIILTGHSLGGVIALYLARLLVKDFGRDKVSYVMTFGCPRPGDNYFADQKSWNGPVHYRVTNELDPVSALPMPTATARWTHTHGGHYNIAAGGRITRNLQGFENPLFLQDFMGTPLGDRRPGAPVTPLPAAVWFGELARTAAGVNAIRDHLLSHYLGRLAFFLNKGQVDRNNQFGICAELLTLNQQLDLVPFERP